MSLRKVYSGFISVIMTETLNGTREFVQATDSVNLLLYDRVFRRVVLVRQVRQAMVRDDNPTGLISETVAGRFDVNLGVKTLMVKEALEETGVTLTEDQIELLNGGQAMALSAGVLTERSYLGFAEITPDQIDQADRIFGAASEQERIKRLFIPVDELEQYQCEDVRVFALIQYLLRKLEKEQPLAMED